MAVKSHQPAEIDMTPMIDCVFQLIIFFIITVNLDRAYREDIVLEDAPRAEIAVEAESKRTLVIEVDKRGWLSVNAVPVQPDQLRAIVKRRFDLLGEFPVLIRADYRTRHRYVRTAMDICSSVGVWKLQFAGVKERKTPRAE